MKLAQLVVIFFVVSLPVASAPSDINITVIAPENSSVFWRDTLLFGDLAARNLGLNVSVKLVPRAMQNRFGFMSIFEEELKAKNPPNYLVSSFWSKSEEALLNEVKRSNVHLVTFNGYLDPELEEIFGQPGQKYSRWLAHFGPNDFDIGYETGRRLIKEVSNRSMASKLNFYGFTGHRHHSASILRSKGFEQAIAEHENAQLLQMVYTDWSADDAFIKTQRLIQRGVTIHGIWSASDNMAIGVVDALTLLKDRVPNGIPVNGIDWNRRVIEFVKIGQVTSSYGGHFTDLAWAIVYIYDHANNIDFDSQTERKVSSNMAFMDAQNANDIARFLKTDKWHQIDFKQLTKTHSGKTTYDFDLRPIIDSTNSLTR